MEENKSNGACSPSVSSAGLGDDDRNLRHIACDACGEKNMRPTGERVSGSQYGCDFDAERFQCVVCGHDYWW